MISLREEEPDDYAAVRQLTVNAFRGSEFGHNGEADLVEAVRSSKGHLSFVATFESEVVGHVMFSSAALRLGAQELSGMGLAPMSVLPSHQRQGIGSALVRFGLDQAFSLGHRFVAVLGHPEFYSRFGFRPASETNDSHGFKGLPQDCFLMCYDASNDACSDASGLVFYDPAFGPQHEDVSRTSRDET